MNGKLLWVGLLGVLPAVTHCDGTTDPSGGLTGSTGGSLGGQGACLPGAGTAGVGGADGTCTLCTTKPDLIEGCVLSGTTLEEEPVAETVTVVSIEEVTGSVCPNINSSESDAVAQHVVLEASDSRRWSLFVRIPDLPADFVSVNESVELTLDAENWAFDRLSQVVSLEQNGELLFQTFAGSLSAGRSLLYQQGIAISDQGPICRASVCGSEDHRARFTIGDAVVDIDPGETKPVGDVRLTLERYDRYDAGGGGCDGGSYLNGALLPIR